MNNQALTLSVVMGLIAVFFVQSYVSSIEEEAQKKFGTEVLVLKASQNIKEMDSINETMVEREKIPKKFLEPAAIYWELSAGENGEKGEKSFSTDLRALIGSIASVPIKKGEQITRNKISEPGVRTGLAPQITPGRRAMALPVSETSAVAKLVKPGDRVDLIAILSPGGGPQNRIARTLLQDVVVLSTGKSVNGLPPRIFEQDAFLGKEKVKNLAEDTTFSNINVEVTPEQAQTLALILSSDGQILLSLRNNDDTDRVPLGPVQLMDLLGGDARARAPASDGGARR